MEIDRAGDVAAAISIAPVLARASARLVEKSLIAVMPTSRRSAGTAVDASRGDASG
jgi:hypothetical protein